METQPNVRKSLIILRAAFISASLIYLLIGVFLSKTNWHPVGLPANVLQILLIVFFAMAFVLSAMAMRLNQSLGDDQTVTGEQSRKTVLSRSITAYALAEVPSILGLVYFLLSGKLLFLTLFCAISIAAFVLLQPKTQL